MYVIWKINLLETVFPRHIIFRYWEVNVLYLGQFKTITITLVTLDHIFKLYKMK